MKWMLSSLLALFLSAPALALEIGATAPDFSVKSSTGKVVRLSDYTGKTVVLEWMNHGCPFVRKHYDSHQMQNLQKEYTGKGVIWLSVVSSAKGKQGYVTEKEAEADRKKYESIATAILLDEKGAVGKSYDAQTTPHIFVVNSKGKLAYQGAADDKPSAEVEDIKGAKSYIKEALDATLAGKPVALSQTKSYGCGVKY
jgi:peroxiredoxin